MSYKPSFVSGDWKAICDQCGRLFKASQLKQRWDGLMVCSGDWEPRQPQDFVRGVADKMVTPWARPEAQDSFVPPAPYVAIAQSGVSLGIRVFVYSPSGHQLNAASINSVTVG